MNPTHTQLPVSGIELRYLVCVVLLDGQVPRLCREAAIRGNAMGCVGDAFEVGGPGFDIDAVPRLTRVGSVRGSPGPASCW